MPPSPPTTRPAVLDPLVVDLGDRSYPIIIGQGLLKSAGELIHRLVPGSLYVISNPTVAGWHLAPLLDSLAQAGRRAEVILIPDGEAYKTAATLAQIHTRLLELGADRKSALLALGGGVVGDLAGYAAATYQRGIDFVQLPTTLLAQVDSSVGGKTGINHAQGKNMLGAFHQPKAVCIDLDCLSTLPPREFAAGMAEVIKYGMIHDEAFLAWLEARVDDLTSHSAQDLGYAIRRSCEIKAQIVGQDERESGDRALLNFGHTFGHAIEAGLGYGNWLHGEAVAAGMLLAAQLSVLLGKVGPEAVERLAALLRRVRLPITPPALGTDRYLQLMAHDKKVELGRLRLVVLERVGAAVVTDAVPESMLRKLLDQI